MWFPRVPKKYPSTLPELRLEGQESIYNMVYLVLRGGTFTSCLIHTMPLSPRHGLTLTWVFEDVMADNIATGGKEETPECRDTSAERVKFLEEELKKSTEERQKLKARVESAEKELASVLGANSKTRNKQQAAYVKKLEADNASLHAAVKKSADELKEKTKTCVMQGKQIEALTSQVGSLREVVSITKDLLTIRNMEVQQLQKDVDSVQEKIALEREKHEKLTLAAKLNADLRKEYMNQVQLFQELKGKYEEKVISLTNENVRLAKLAQVNSEQ